MLQDLLGSTPAQWTHREVVVIPAVVYPQLTAEILKGIEGMGGIETFIVLPVAAVPPYHCGGAYKV